MKAGTYYVKEKSAPPGYQVDPSVITAKINTNATTDVTSSETPYRRGQIKLKKVDAVFGVTLSDAEFTLYRWSDSAGDYVLDSKIVDQKKDVTPIGEWVQKSGKWWYRYPDGSYPTNEWIWDENYKKYYHFDGNGWKDKESTTRPETAADTDGVYDSGYIHTSADNPDGKFKIEETKVPDNYSGSFTKEFTITDNVQLFAGSLISRLLHRHHTPHTLTYDVANEWSRISGQIRLVKTDYETRSTLEGGAVFNVYEWDAKANAYREDPVDTLVYDADAKVYL